MTFVFHYLPPLAYGDGTYTILDLGVAEAPPRYNARDRTTRGMLERCKGAPATTPKLPSSGGPRTAFHRRRRTT